MRKLLVLIAMGMFIASLSYVIAENETNDTMGDVNISLSVCGDGNMDTEEECDDDIDVLCSPDYGQTCSYCSNECKVITLSGRYCGDGNMDTEEECDDGNQDNADYCSNECKKTYECTFDSECDDGNPCTENKCPENKCQKINLDGKRRGDEYCLNGNLENQKDKDVLCDENYECATNTCSQGVCTELVKEPGFIEKIINAIIAFFAFWK